MAQSREPAWTWRRLIIKSATGGQKLKIGASPRLESCSPSVRRASYLMRTLVRHLPSAVHSTLYRLFMTWFRDPNISRPHNKLSPPAVRRHVIAGISSYWIIQKFFWFNPIKSYRWAGRRKDWAASCTDIRPVVGAAGGWRHLEELESAGTRTGCRCSPAYWVTWRRCSGAHCSGPELRPKWAAKRPQGQLVDDSPH